MIAAVILARDSRPNPSLMEMVDVLHQVCIDRVVIVVNSEKNKTALEWFGGNIVVDDEKQEAALLASIVKGFDATEKDDLHGIIVCDSRYPNISRAMIVNLLQGFWKSQKNIILPNMNGLRCESPVILENSVVERLKIEIPPGGMNTLFIRYPDEVGEVFITAEEKP